MYTTTCFPIEVDSLCKGRRYRVLVTIRIVLYLQPVLNPESYDGSYHKRKYM